MHRGLSNGGAPGMTRHHLHRDKGVDLSNFLDDPGPSSPERPESASSLRRHVAASLMQHRRLFEKNNHALQPISPASYESSLEVGPYRPADTPTSSLDFKGRVTEPHYSLKTSTELLKVLNRIWSLEEQHASSVALIKALKTELDNARVRIKSLLRDRQADRHEIDDLMKQIAEDKLARKNKEQDRIHAAVQSIRDELEDERKLRKRSESLHRKLARELSEVKSSLSTALKDLEKERRSRTLLEDMCDEFAKGIKCYEQEVHGLKQKSDKDWGSNTNLDRLILHVSESWLDERMQMKLEEAQSGVAGKKSIVDKLGFEIETFLQAKRMAKSKTTDNISARNRRASLESVPLNEAVSVPQDVGNDDDSASSDSNCFELNGERNNDFRSRADERNGNVKSHAVEIDKHSAGDNVDMKSKPASHRRVKSRSPSNLPVNIEEQMASDAACNGNTKSLVVDPVTEITEEGNTIDVSMSRRSEHCGVTEDGDVERKIKQNEAQRSSSNHMADNISSWRGRASPVRQWMTKLTNPDLGVSESSTKAPPGVKENTLKARLLEARSKGQRSRTRGSKVHS